MKALSIKQPWAGLIASGRKTIETRTWSTNHRGDLLIVCSARPDGPQARQALCIVSVVDCRPMIAEDASAACCELYPGAWAWILANIRPIRKPFTVKGRMGLFDVPFTVIHKRRKGRQ